jgi:hypothetical protein
MVTSCRAHCQGRLQSVQHQYHCWTAQHDEESDRLEQERNGHDLIQINCEQSCELKNPTKHKLCTSHVADVMLPALVVYRYMVPGTEIHVNTIFEKHMIPVLTIVV